MNRFTKKYIYTCLIVLGLVVIHSRVSAQCTYDIVTPIPDNGILNIDLIVSGLTDNNLSSPTQGICGVEIDFDHEYLGDLTISLVSPNGTSITLIGPTTTAITPTNLSSWDIEFIPCAAVAAPDPGFSAQWNNLQPWQALTAYAGSYFPQSGCLEDFDSGSANGLWQIVVEDHETFQLGSIKSITLLFCNPVGLECLLCTPNAGTLSPSLMEICSGDNIQSSAISIDFGGNTPDPLLYTYEYLLVSGMNILQSGTNFSITPAIGNYSICGLSYLNGDSAVVNALLATNDYDLLTQAVNQGIICADLSSSCITLNVVGKPDTVFVTGDLCGGEIFSYGGQNYSTDGIFYQIKDGPGLCDTTVEIRIHPRSLTVAVGPPDTLFCGSGDVVLNANANGGPGPFTYQWSTVNGNITSPSNSATISVNQSGQYFVHVSDGVCEGTGSANVVAGPNFPQVIFTGGTITCTNPVVNIKPIYSPASANVLWSGPLGFTSTQPNIGVTVPGTYTMNITNASGCTTTKSVDIGIDTMTVQLDVIEINRDCQDQTITLADNHSDLLVNWQWSGPNGFMSNYWRPIVSTPGTYTFIGTFSNGCTRSNSYNFDGDFSIPDLQVSLDDTLNCNELVILSATSSVPGPVFSWRGPNNFSSNQSSVMTDQYGSYFVQVMAQNGCKNFDTIAVVEGNDIFDYQIITDTLTCLKSMATIGVIAPDADLFDWINYTGPGDDQSMIQVNNAGLYMLKMTDTITGCEVRANILVYEDFVIPSFGFTSDTITCSDPVAELSFLPQSGFTYTSVFWELPDLSIEPGFTIASSLPGVYKLIATGPNGCQGIRNIDVPIDTLRPFLILNTDTLTCNDTVTIIAQSLDSITTLQWSGSGIIDFMDFSINVNQPGWYSLSASGPNGCPSEYAILVDSNFTRPSYTLTADSLRCDMPATISIVPDNDYAYTWFDPENGVIGTDSFIVISEPGQYTIQVVGSNQCITHDTISFGSLEYPQVELLADTFTCLISTVSITANADISPYTIAWLDFNEDTISQSVAIDVTTPGPFISSVTGPNGCITRDTISPQYDTIPPLAIIQLDGEIRCQMKNASLDGTASGPGLLSFLWSTSNGNILSDPTSATIDILDTGVYILQITELVNGCVGSDTLQVGEHPDAITNVDLLISSPECHGEGNASVAIEGVNGGVGVINYQLNSGPLQTTPIFDELSAGQYLLTLIDEANCVFDTLVQIDTSIIFSVDAGPDIEIYLGEEAEIEGLTDLPLDNIMSTQWSAYNNSICSDCNIINESPLETTTYTFQVTSSTGCVLSDDMIVFVLEKARFFIANIFSPNGDGANDFVNLNSTGGIEKVLQWVIFDRWGNAVFGATNFDPMDSSVFWDGRTTTGEFSNPGVFPYVIEFQLISGKVITYHGEITLIR